MSEVTATRLVNDYLRRLEAELSDLPAEKRSEILQEIRGHIVEARSAMRSESDAEVMNLLERLGDPSEIAAEAHGTASLPRARTQTFDVLALLLMVLAWPAGVVLLWWSKSWTTREKVLGTLVPPGGYPGVFLIMSTFRFFVKMADAGPSWVHVTVGAVLFTISLLLIVAPVGMTVYLLTRLRIRR